MWALKVKGHMFGSVRGSDFRILRATEPRRPRIKKFAGHPAILSYSVVCSVSAV